MKEPHTETGEGRRAVCVSCSNMTGSQENSISIKLCEILAKQLSGHNIESHIVDLRKYELFPCVGCGECYESRRCCCDPRFNEIYDSFTRADYLFFVSPHYAPIPSKLAVLLEKMEQITFLHWWKDNHYQAELYGIPAGIISHGGAGEWALPSYKEMVNDTIANALDTIQIKVIPYDDTWNTGISMPVKKVVETDSIFPVQEYDCNVLETKIRAYAKRVLQGN